MSQNDAFENYGSGLDSPFSFALAIAPGDSADLAHVPRALYATGAGDVRLSLRGGGDPVVLPMLAGVPLPARATRVWATGTTATGLVGVW